MDEIGISVIMRPQGKLKTLEAQLASFVEHNTHEPVEVIIFTDEIKEVERLVLPYKTQIPIRLFSLLENGSIETVAKSAQYEKVLLVHDKVKFLEDPIGLFAKRLMEGEARILGKRLVLVPRGRLARTELGAGASLDEIRNSFVIGDINQRSTEVTPRLQHITLEAEPFNNNRLNIKVLLIHPRRLGILGTPGSYLLAESLSELVELRVICNKDGAEGATVVHDSNPALQMKEISFKEEGYEAIAEFITEFEPDVIQFSAWRNWAQYVTALKKRYPSAVYIVDFKSPQLANESIAKDVRALGDTASQYLDLALTLGDYMNTWSNDFARPTLQYPLGVNFDSFKPLIDDNSLKICKKFVYVGSTHKKRRIDLLLAFINNLSEDLKSQVTFDFYGSGENIESYRQYITENQLEDIVAFKNAVPQMELFEKLRSYDAGLAWVPWGIYNDSPSLKFLEYAGSGLAILATDTKAHRTNVSYGFSAALFSKDPISFESAVEELVCRGVSNSALKRNFDHLKNFDWKKIAKEYFLFAYSSVFVKKLATQVEQEKLRALIAVAAGSISELSHPFISEKLKLIESDITNYEFR